MFRCTKCKNIDKFELMFSPDYKGKGVISKEINSKGEIIITVDGYTFIPDLMFMNGHAVCGFCGEINHWTAAESL
ncbi:MAG: hypothetical protein WC197_05290 [Candidatus Gastranaerophilaceae bacterium]|jgi:hypothetical protein